MALALNFTRVELCHVCFRVELFLLKLVRENQPGFYMYLAVCLSHRTGLPKFTLIMDPNVVYRVVLIPLIRAYTVMNILLHLYVFVG